MHFINRNTAIIKPRQPFLDWLESVPDPDLDVTLEELRQDCTAVLIPEADSEAESRNYIEGIYKEIFEMELNSWYQDRGLWPEEITLAMFRRWFDIEIHSEVVDLEEGEIGKEEYA
jgi:hypothetical protein